MLNQPEVDWETGVMLEPENTADMWDFGDYDYDIYNTEIARRGSLLGPGIDKVDKQTSRREAACSRCRPGSRASMNQGGPADVMSRRIVIPKRQVDAQNGWQPLRIPQHGVQAVGVREG